MTRVLPSRFTSLLDLTHLPWFGISEEGRFVMTDKSIGPIADLHTHWRSMSVDLNKLHPETLHYLPSCCAIDLDVYVNRNMSPEIVKELTRDLTLRRLGPRSVRATHTIPNLTREMDETRIRALFVGPVHPYASNLEMRLDAQLAKGARGIKMHPSVVWLETSSCCVGNAARPSRHLLILEITVIS
jgi:hypothetical protein